jgi:hypothetical protein
VQAALGSKTETGVQSINQQTLPLSEQFNQKLADVQGQVPDSTRLKFFIDQGDRAVGLADRVNYDLVPILIDIGDADPILSKTKVDLKTSRNVLSTGNLELTKTPMRLVQKDLVDLAQAYRDIAHIADLPPALSAELNTLALRLDATAGQMGAAL